MNFDNFNWHDAVIKNMQVDRSSPGTKDNVILEIIWPHDEGNAKLTFEEVYWASLNSNFGFVADESILGAQRLSPDNFDLANFYKKWKGLMNNEQLATYYIQFNTTGSEIKIIAMGFKVEAIT